MECLGWYYLHTNKELIFKRELGDTASDLRESDFVMGIWPYYGDRFGAWNILVEALSAGADKIRIKELATKWGLDNKDADIYATALDIQLYADGGQMCAVKNDFINLQESVSGFGNSSLEAISDLCKNLGYVAGKMWNRTFPELLKDE